MIFVAFFTSFQEAVWKYPFHMISISSWKVPPKAYTQPKNLLALGTHTANSASERERHSFRSVQTERFYRLQTRNFHPPMRFCPTMPYISPWHLRLWLVSQWHQLAHLSGQTINSGAASLGILTSGLLDCFLCNSTLLKNKQKSRNMIEVNRKWMQKKIDFGNEKKTPGLLNCTKTLPKVAWPAAAASFWCDHRA